MTEIQNKLITLSDSKYKEFHSKLMPTVNTDTVLGVRVPLLRKYAKELNGTDLSKEFLKELPHTYYEENNIHAFLIEKITDYDTLIEKLNTFLPFVDNWATCDMMSPKVFAKHKEKLIEQIKIWITSAHTYTVRYGIKCLMQHFLDKDFKEEYLHLAASTKSEEYYVNMMIAWFFQEALTKQYESAVVFLQKRLLSPFVHTKTISKANDSFRISTEKKQYLKTLRY